MPGEGKYDDSESKADDCRGSRQELVEKVKSLTLRGSMLIIALDRSKNSFTRTMSLQKYLKYGQMIIAM